MCAKQAVSQVGLSSNVKATGNRAVQFELKTTVEGMARVFEISVKERS